MGVKRAAANRACQESRPDVFGWALEILARMHAAESVKIQGMTPSGPIICLFKLLLLALLYL
jgi:hypothetical protein